MNLIDLVTTLYKIGQMSVSHRFDLGDTVKYQVKSMPDVVKTLDAAGINYDKNGKDEISVNIHQYPGLFYNSEHFLQESALFLQHPPNTDGLNSNIGILFYLGDNYLYYDSVNGITYTSKKPDQSDFFIQNTYYYWKIYQLFNSLKINEHNSSSNREFILVSPQKGKFTLGYPAIPPGYHKNIRIRDKYTILIKSNQSQEFYCFFKEQIIDFLSSYKHDERFPKFIENVETIIETSINNYEVYLNKFNFEELKKNFRKERDEYFSKIRDIIDSVLNKVVAIPISVSAAALALYELKNEPNYAVIVAIAFIVYSLFSSYLLRLVLIDVFGIVCDLESDVKIIKSSSNIPDSILAEETSKVSRRIRILNRTIIILQIICAILSLAVLYEYFQFTSMPPKWIELSLACVLDIQLFISFAFLKRKKQNIVKTRKNSRLSRRKR
jgi:hypothetical protein